MGLEPTTLHTLDRVLYQYFTMFTYSTLHYNSSKDGVKGHAGRVATSLSLCLTHCAEEVSERGAELLPGALGSCHDDERGGRREGDQGGGECRLEGFRGNIPPGVDAREVED